MHENWGEKKYFEQSNTDLLKAWYGLLKDKSSTFFM